MVLPGNAMDERPPEDRVEALLAELQRLPPDEKNQKRLLAVVLELGELRDPRAARGLADFENQVSEQMRETSLVIDSIAVPQAQIDESIARMRSGQIGTVELMVRRYLSAQSLRERLTRLRSETRAALDAMQGDQPA